MHWVVWALEPAVGPKRARPGSHSQGRGGRARRGTAGNREKPGPVFSTAVAKGGGQQGSGGARGPPSKAEAETSLPRREEKGRQMEAARARPEERHAE
eukprot:4217804-Heterocapsa_arctica.AAC.1